MKTIKINYLTYYFLLVYFLAGLIKEGIIIFLIVVIHELGHVLAAKINKYEIIKIEIYPFGGITKLKHKINSPFMKDIFLFSSGIIFQMFLYIIMNFLNNYGVLSSHTFNIFKTYNMFILIFNLLPILPLDGSKLSELILSKFMPYKTSYILNIIISVISVIILIFYNYYYSFNNYLIFFFLIYKIIETIKERHYIFNKFLLERYLYDNNLKGIINEKSSNINKLRKYYYFYFWNKDKWLNEKEVLKNKFIS